MYVYLRKIIYCGQRRWPRPHWYASHLTKRNSWISTWTHVNHRNRKYRRINDHILVKSVSLHLKKIFYLQNKIFHWRCKVLKISEFLKSDYYTIFQGLLGWTYSVNVTYAKGLNTSSGNLRGSHLISTNWYNLLHVIQINYIHTIIWTEWLLINNKADTKLLIFK